MKLGKLIIDIDGTELSKMDIEILRHPYIGGVILFSRNFSSVMQLTSLINSIKLLRSPSLIIYVDQEGGNVQRFKDGLTLLPAIDLLGKKYIISCQWAGQVLLNIGNVLSLCHLCWLAWLLLWYFRYTLSYHLISPLQ